MMTTKVQIQMFHSWHKYAFSNIVTDEDRDEFFEKLALLQAQANIFLKMLNDMRRRLKELSQNSAATQQYKYMIKFMQFLFMRFLEMS